MQCLSIAQGEVNRVKNELTKYIKENHYDLVQSDILDSGILEGVMKFFSESYLSAKVSELISEGLLNEEFVTEDLIDISIIEHIAEDLKRTYKDNKDTTNTSIIEKGLSNHVNKDGILVGEYDHRDTAKTGYTARTKFNVENSDFTVMAYTVDSSGETLTRKLANDLRKPILEYSIQDIQGNTSRIKTDIAKGIIKKIENTVNTQQNSITINIAGNGLYNFDALNQEDLNTLFENVFKDVYKYIQTKDIDITLNVISGGQTGIDEAGVIGARRAKQELGIKEGTIKVNAPKGFVHRIRIKNVTSEKAANYRRYTSIKGSIVKNNRDITFIFGSTPEYESLSDENKIKEYNNSEPKAIKKKWLDGIVTKDRTSYKNTLGFPILENIGNNTDSRKLSESYKVAIEYFLSKYLEREDSYIEKGKGDYLPAIFPEVLGNMDYSFSEEEADYIINRFKEFFSEGVKYNKEKLKSGGFKLILEKNDRAVDLEGTYGMDLYGEEAFSSRFKSGRSQGNLTLNVYSNNNEYSEFSNSAIRPFIIDKSKIADILGLDDNSIKHTEFHSVEQAFHYFKVLEIASFVDNLSDVQKEVLAKTINSINENADNTSKIKRITSSNSAFSKAFNISNFFDNPKYWAITGDNTDSVRYKLMEHLMTQSFNSEAGLKDKLELGKLKLQGYRFTNKNKGKEQDYHFSMILNSIGEEAMSLVDKEMEDVVDYNKVSQTVRSFSTIDLDKMVKESEEAMTSSDRYRKAKSIAYLFRDVATTQLEEYKDSLRAKLNSDETRSTYTPEEITALENEIKKLDVYSYVERMNTGEITAIFRQVKENLYDTIYDDEGNLTEYAEELKEEGNDTLINFLNGITYFEALVLTAKYVIRDSLFMPIPYDLFDDAIYDIAPKIEEYKLLNAADLEENPLEGWQINDITTSSYDRHSLRMKRFISSIPEINIDNNFKIGELGVTSYLDPRYVSAVLLSYTKDITHFEDLEAALDDMLVKYPHMVYIKEALIDNLDILGNEDPEMNLLKSEFFHTFLTGHNTYTVQKKDDKGKLRTITVNHSRAENSYYEEWVKNHEDRRLIGNIEEEDAIYNEHGYKPEAAKRLQESLKEIHDALISNSSEGKELNLNTLNENLSDSYGDNEYITNLLYILNAMGISTSREAIASGIKNYVDPDNKESATKDAPYRSNFIRLVRNMDIILRAVADNRLKGNKDGNTSIFADYSKAFSTIANILNYTDRLEVEAVFRQDGVQLSSYVKSFGIGELVKRIKAKYRSTNDPYKTGTQEYILKKWREDSFMVEYYNEENIPVFYNEWLNLLYSEPNASEDLDLSVLYTIEGKEHNERTPIEEARGILTEYDSIPKSTNGSYQRAKYYIPIMSDSGISRFITFYRYTEDNYQETITNLLAKLVKQEIKRINNVLTRAKKFKTGELNPNTDYIVNYDLKYNEETNTYIKGTGGSTFHFLPQLNNLVLNNGRSFIEEYNNISLQDKATTDELDELIYEAVGQIIHNILEDNLKLFKNAFKSELLEENPETGKKEIVSVLKSIMGTSNYEKIKTEYPQVIRLLQESNINDALNKTNELDSIIKSIEENGLIEDTTLEEDFLNDLRNLNNEEIKLEKRIIEFTWNSTYAQSQIFQLTVGDLAYFSSPEDVQKRFKQIHSPVDRLNTLAIDRNGNRVGTEIEKSIYLKDITEDSLGLSMLDEFLQQIVDKKFMSPLIKESILSKFMNINSTDGQSFRTLKGYKKILTMAGILKPEVEEAIDRLANGEVNYADFKVLFQTIKPFAAGTTLVDDGMGGKMNKPFQHKNSEAVLMAIVAALNEFYKFNPQMQALAQFMDDNNIDVAHFESAVKVGGHAIIDISIPTMSSRGVDISKEGILGYLNSIIEDSPNYIHETDFMDYGFQTANPEHLIDTVQLIGTQVRKIVMGDLAELMKTGVTIRINREEKTIKEWLDHYNELNTANIVDSFIQVSEIFKDPTRIEELLVAEISTNPKYSKTLIPAVRYDKLNKRFNIPLEDPLITMEIQAVLNSVLKNRINKQEIKGGSATLTSDIGFSSSLQIEYNEDGSIKGIPCYLPVFSEEMTEALIAYNKANGREDTFVLDINATINGKRIVDEELLKGFGYRIPTENLYSTVPLIIKGFLPSQMGGSIILPKEVIALSGADFDIDKLFLMLKEFNTINVYNEEIIKEDNGELLKLKGKTVKQYIEYLETTDSAQLNKYIIGKRFKAVQYNSNKYAIDNSRKARNNRIIDSMFAMITHKDNMERFWRPGDFDILKKGMYIIRLVNSANIEELTRELKINGGNELNLLSVLDSMTIPELKELTKKYTPRQANITLATHLYYFRQNNTGAALIGGYANHNMNHIIMQNLQTKLDPRLGFKFNNKNIKSISEEFAIKQGDELDRQTRISVYLASFVAASVDNAKDPVLSDFLQSLETYNLSMYLIRVGLSPLEVGLLLNTPMVKGLLEEHYSPKSLEEALLESLRSNISAGTVIINEERSIGNYIHFEATNEANITSDTLVSMIISPRDSKFELSNMENIEATLNVILYKAVIGSKLVGDATTRTKVDTTKGATGPYIYNNMFNRARLQELEEFAEQYPLIENWKPFKDINEDVIKYAAKDGNKYKLMELMSRGEIPLMQAMYSLSANSDLIFLKDLFFHYTDKVEQAKEIIEYLIGRKLNETATRQFYQELSLYAVMKDEDFYDIAEEDGIKVYNEITLGILKGTPKVLMKAKKEIRGNAFLDYLQVYKSGTKLGFPIITPRRNHKLSNETKELIREGWLDLYNSSKEEHHNLAVWLFKYALLRNGLASGPNSFIGLAPIELRNSIGSYSDNVDRLREGNLDLTNFPMQFIRNHIGDEGFMITRRGVKDPKEVKLKGNNAAFNPIRLTFNAEDLWDDYNKNLLVNVRKRDSEGRIYWVAEPVPVFGVSNYYNEQRHDFVYRLNDIERDEYGSIISVSYTRLDRLGVANEMKEYYYYDSNDMRFEDDIIGIKSPQWSKYLEYMRSVKSGLEYSQEEINEGINKGTYITSFTYGNLNTLKEITEDNSDTITEGEPVCK